MPLLDSRALIDPQFEIDVEIIPSAGDELIVNWEVTALDTVNNPIIVHVVVIEDTVNIPSESFTYYNMVKQMLPNPAGSVSSLVQFNPGDKHTNSQIPWTIDVPIYDSTALSVVVFVQEKTNGSRPGEIYQSKVTKVIDKKWSSIVTGIEDIMVSAAESIDVYPNPVQRELYFVTDNQITERFNWKIVDQRGVQIASDEFRFKYGEYMYDTEEIPNGIYYLIISMEDKPLTYEKLIIMHR